MATEGSDIVSNKILCLNRSRKFTKKILREISIFAHFFLEKAEAKKLSVSNHRSMHCKKQYCLSTNWIRENVHRF